MRCSTCHTVTRDRADSTGPPLYGLYGSERRFTDGPTAIADADYIRESITHPAAKIVEGYPNGQSAFTDFDDLELDWIVEFLKAISDNHDELHEPLVWHRNIVD